MGGFPLFTRLLHRQLLHQCGVRVGQQGVVCGVDHHAGPCTGGLFHELHRGVIHRDFGAVLGLGEVGRQRRGLQQALLIRLNTAGAEDDGLGVDRVIRAVVGAGLDAGDAVAGLVVEDLLALGLQHVFAAQLRIALDVFRLNDERRVSTEIPAAPMPTMTVSWVCVSCASTGVSGASKAAPRSW